MSKRTDRQAERLTQIPQEAEMLRRQGTTEITRIRVGSDTYALKWTNCNSRGCNACPHGPYWYRTWTQGGKTRWQYIGKNLQKHRLARRLETIERDHGEPRLPGVEPVDRPLPDEKPDWITDQVWADLEDAVAGHGLTEKGRQRLRLLLDANIGGRMRTAEAAETSDVAAEGENVA